MNDAFAKNAGNAMALTVNVHGSSVELLSVDESRLVAGHGSGEYLPNGVDRLLDLFSRRQLKATFFVPGREAERNPSLIREIAAEGHEIAANGYQFEDFSKGADQDHEVLKRSHDILASCVGVAPIGWRAPKGLLSAVTLKSLTSLGYVYDSSFQDDDLPYWLDADGGAGMLELPQNHALIDETFYAGKYTDVRVLKNWTEELDGLNSVGAFICMTVHPRQDYGIGRPPRMAIFEQLLEYARYSNPSIRFVTCGELARRLQS